MEIVGLVTLSVLMMLCTVAGIGGGGITIPILQVFFVFEFKEATAISGISILICSIARFIYNFGQQHPEKKAVAIDYGLAIIMLPTVMMGSFIGVIMNAAMPDLILQVCLTLLLGFLTVQSAFKAREIMRKENEKLKAKKKKEKEEKRESNRILGIEESDEVKEDKDLNWEDNSNSTDPSFVTTQSMVITNNTANKDTMVTTAKAENEIASPKQ
jgi:uncharacterized membrane protein YfcA